MDPVRKALLAMVEKMRSDPEWTRRRLVEFDIRQLPHIAPADLCARRGVAVAEIHELADGIGWAWDDTSWQWQPVAADAMPPLEPLTTP